MPRPSRLVWRSELGWPATSAASADPKSGLVIHYDSYDQRLASRSHSACIDYWNRTRDFHTGPRRGWSDIGYSFMACPHGYVLEGRGLFKSQAAQIGYNATYYSCTLATGPTDAIPEAQIEAVRELRQWLMEPDTSISGKVLGHRDLNSTSCPGDRAYRLVRNGTFAQPPSGGTSPAPDDTSEDFLDMADLTWVSSHTTQKLPKGETVCLLWQNGRNDKITDDNPYATIAFQNHKFTGSLNGRVVALDENGELVPVAYRVQLGKVTGAKSAAEPPNPLFRGGVYVTTECNVSLDEITFDDERLRVYVTALVDGCEWRGGKVTGWLASR